MDKKPATRFRFDFTSVRHEHGDLVFRLFPDEDVESQQAAAELKRAISQWLASRKKTNKAK